MKLAHIYIEHPVMSLDHTFSYQFHDIHIERGMRVQVPFGNKQLIGFVDHIEEVSDDFMATLDYELKEVISVVDEEPLIDEELFQLAKWMAKECIAATISCFQVMLPAKLKPRTTMHKIKMEAWIRYRCNKENLTVKQQEALLQMKKLHEIKKSEYVKLFKSPGKKLIEIGCVEEFEKEAQALMGEHVINTSPFVLSEEQQAAIKQISNDKHHEIVLLHGVTGSGKTEVFLQLAKAAVDEDKQVLFLVPEISLTPQMVERVRARFGSDVAIYHSGLNSQEKYEQFQLVKHRKVHVVVGTRSAVFMPFHQLGLIIMDEEHDQSYKQESSPRYHCRDIAIERGKYHDCKVILASATPSLESYARAHKHVYQLIEMKQRINQNFPKVKLVEMKKAIKKQENYMLSNALLDGIYERLQKKEQVLLLLNRRGYTPILRCIQCGYVQMCPHCDIAMSYHKEGNVLKCHTCGEAMELPNFCPDCGKSAWRYLGIGTQRLEELVQQKFPMANIIRMDSDTTSKKNAHEKLLDEFFENGDILLGTQMIAKGLDFERVTLVGIINGDAMLQRSDYRSAELTYDLLEQACGRSGRGEFAGEVIIQAYDTHHYAITCAANHNYVSFFNQEMQYRHLANYPPYQYLASMVFLHEDLAQAMQCATTVRNELSTFTSLRILGPSELLKIKDESRVRILLKGKNQNEINQVVNTIYRKYITDKRKARLEIDLQPLILD